MPDVIEIIPAEAVSILRQRMICPMAFRRPAKLASQAFLISLALLFAVAGARAEGVTIQSDDPAQSIKLDIDSATVRDVLNALRDKYGVELAGDESAGADDPMTLSLQGNLPTILERLLRNQNYMIVRSDRNVTGVAKILITVPDRTKGKLAPAAAQPETTPMP